MKRLCSFALVFWAFDAPALARDPFPEPVPAGNITVRVLPYITVPDYIPGRPPRLNLLTPDPAGRLFVNDQCGPLYHIDQATTKVTRYLNLDDHPGLQLTCASKHPYIIETGFQSFAFHPDFTELNTDGFGRFYTIHSSTSTSSQPDFELGHDAGFHTLLLEWRTADPAAPVFMAADQERPYREVLRIKQPFDNHNGGMIGFNPTARPEDPDYGNLYIALGDGGAGGDPFENGQNLSTPFGALLRIEPIGTDGKNGQYGIVQGNVFAADGDDRTLGEIYAHGLRNPQRFGWDTATTKMYVADIGQGTIEEINFVINGGNFGWDEREGSFKHEGDATSGFIDPVAEYDHTNHVNPLPTNIGNRAVTIGDVVRGARIPDLEGQLVISDFPTGIIFILDVDNDPLDGGQDGLRVLQLIDEKLNPTTFVQLINKARALRGLPPVDRTDLRFGSNTPGEVYILNKHDGTVRRLAPFAAPDTWPGLPPSVAPGGFGFRTTSGFDNKEIR